MKSHIEVIQGRHDQLDQLIQKEERSLGSRGSNLNVMKKKRLKLKEELATLTNNNIKAVIVRH